MVFFSHVKFSIILIACLKNPFPVVVGGKRKWDRSRLFGSVVQYICPDGVTRSYTVCDGNKWISFGKQTCQNDGSSTTTTTTTTTTTASKATIIDSCTKGFQTIKMVEGETYHLISPGFPKNYPNSQLCKWKFIVC